MLTPDIGIGRAATQGRGSQASGQASSSTQVYTSAPGFNHQRVTRAQARQNTQASTLIQGSPGDVPAAPQHPARPASDQGAGSTSIVRNTHFLVISVRPD